MITYASGRQVSQLMHLRHNLAALLHTGSLTYFQPQLKCCTPVHLFDIPSLGHGL
jgi:hypothetical protein